MSEECAGICNELGISATLLGVGVDRVDYTKGILERFRAVERFLESNPSYRGEFTFVELGAPSRTLIKRYGDFNVEVEEEASRVNVRFQTRDWKPIVLLKGQHSHQTIEPFYRAADVCMVTSTLLPHQATALAGHMELSDGARVVTVSVTDAQLHVIVLVERRITEA